MRNPWRAARRAGRRVPGDLASQVAGYSLVWSDEFDGAAGAPADPRTWRAETGGHGWGNQELQYYTDGTGNATLDGPAISPSRYGEQTRRWTGTHTTAVRIHPRG